MRATSLPEHPQAANGRDRMNVDAGIQADGGAKAVVMGNIATSITNCQSKLCERKRR